LVLNERLFGIFNNLGSFEHGIDWVVVEKIIDWPAHRVDVDIE
jgi:hypothetical protein